MEKMRAETLREESRVLPVQVNARVVMVGMERSGRTQSTHSR